MKNELRAFIDEASGNVSADSKSTTQTAGNSIMDAPKVPDSVVSEIDATTEPINVKLYFKHDCERIAEGFIKEHCTNGTQRLIHYFDGHLHYYNGVCYEKLTKMNSQLLHQRLRQYVWTLRLIDERRRAVLTPTTKKFYNDITESVRGLCELTEAEAEKFKTPPKNLVFGKTKIWNMETETFHEYNPSYYNTFTLDYDVAENDDEPEVWGEFFNAAGMGPEQQRSWWYQRSVILMQDRKHNRIFYNFGSTRSGKGTTTAIDVAFFGKCSTATIPRRLGKHSMAPLVGKQLLLINDMKFDRHVNSDFIQFLLNCAGDDLVSVEAKYRDAFDYMLEGNLVISSNELPNFRGYLSGLERKFVFNVFHRTQDVNPTLKERMLATMPQIIRKAAKIYPEVVASGYNFDTEQGFAMAGQLLEASSVVKRFVEEMCTFGEDCQVRTVELFTIFREYASKRSEHVSSLSQFETELTTSYLGKVTIGRIREPNSRYTYFKGICITPLPQPERPSLVEVPT